MKGALKFLIALVTAFLVMFVFRALVITIYTVDGHGLEPVLRAGDQVIVNRWSYGLRTGGEGSLFDYGRICRQEVRKGDLIAFEDTQDHIFICRCVGVPGDTISIDLKYGSGETKPHTVIIPGKVTCDERDFYWVEPLGDNNPISSEQLGFVPEERIIGRACLVLFGHNPELPFWQGWRGMRLIRDTSADKNRKTP
jgi:signal peptidase I